MNCLFGFLTEKVQRNYKINHLTIQIKDVPIATLTLKYKYISVGTIDVQR